MRKCWLLVLLQLCTALTAAESIPEPSDAVKKHLTGPVIALIKSTTSIEAFRVGKLDPEKVGTPETVGARLTQSEGRAVPDALKARILAALFADDTYFKSDSKGTTTGVAYRLKSPEGTVEVSYCLQKGNVWIVAKNAAGKVIHQGDKRGFRDDVNSPMRQIAAELYVQDADVQKWKPKAKVTDQKADEPAKPAEQPAGNFSATTKVDASSLRALKPGEFPPGWLPVDRLDDNVVWPEFRKTSDRIMLYLPPGSKPVRGVFVCYVFHSSDPRELARLWNFALVTVPTPFEYDLGFYDKRNPRPHTTGLAMGNMGLILSYLDSAAKELNRPELAKVPLVGWLGQNGAPLCADLYARAPERVLAWSDAWYQNWPKYPDMVAKVPVVSAWEFNNEKQRADERLQKGTSLADTPTPPMQLRCYATTYGFPHGIYSKYSFFVAYIDRCIQARMPETMPEPGQAVKLKDIDLRSGWAGDFNEVNEWAAIAPVNDAKGMIDPTWMPDAYAAWMWRSFHSCKPDIRITSPAIEYQKIDGKWGGPQCGLGYNGTLKASEAMTFSAETSGKYTSVEFHDGDKIVAIAEKSPWKAEGVRLERGLRVLFAVGVTSEGKRTASRPAFVIVE